MYRGNATCHVTSSTKLSSSFNNNDSHKPLFETEEKVLCYEPDPTKAKVLYDSKVLEVKYNKIKKLWEYKIHFQGWNSSWDRYVAEEFVMKDTEKNRELQERLHEKAQLLQQSLKRTKKKSNICDAFKNGRLERRRCLSMPASDGDGLESFSPSIFSDSEDSSDDSDIPKESQLDEDEDEEDDDKGGLTLTIPEEMKRRLEQDYELVTQDERLVKVPATPCVAQILEDYVKYYGLKEMLHWAERAKNQESFPPPVVNAIPPTVPISPPAVGPSTKLQGKVSAPTTVCSASAKVDDQKWDELKHIKKKINFVKEVVDGLRLMFDFLHERILVYKQEARQLSTSKTFRPSLAHEGAKILDDLITKCQNEFREPEDEKDRGDEPPPVKRLTRTSKVNVKCADSIEDTGNDSCASPRGRVSSSDSSCNASHKSSKKRSPSPDSRKRARKYMAELLSWKLIPEDMYDIVPPNPSLIYGVIHLMRLFVKMPEILSKTSIPRRRLRIIISQIHLLLNFVGKHDGSHDKRCLYYRSHEEQMIHERSWHG